jgi:orotate phosphoribosyltransferase
MPTLKCGIDEVAKLMTPKRDREYLLSELGKAFLKTSAFRIGDFRTAKGTKTPYYVDLSRVSSFSNVFALTIECLEQELDKISTENKVDALCGVPITGLLFSAVVANRESKPLVHSPPDQEQKIIGVISPGANVVVIDDVSETGKSIEQAANAIRANGGVVTDALTLIDRSEEARSKLEKADIKLHSFTTVQELAKKLQDNLALSDEEEALLENDA